LKAEKRGPDLKRKRSNERRKRKLTKGAKAKILGSKAAKGQRRGNCKTWVLAESEVQSGLFDKWFVGLPYGPK